MSTNATIAAYYATFGTAFSGGAPVSRGAATVAAQTAATYTEMANEAEPQCNSWQANPAKYDGQASQLRMQVETIELLKRGWRETSVGYHFAMRSPNGRYIVRYVRESGRKQVRSYFEPAVQ